MINFYCRTTRFDNFQKELIMSIPSVLEITKQLITMQTVNPPGNELPAQEYLQGLLEQGGFHVQRLEKVPGRPNLVTYLSGTGERDPLLFYGHTDVVGVEGQDWDKPPFAGVEQDEVLFGRGTLDMKAGIAMLVHTLLRAKASNLQPAGDIILAIVVDEETGGEMGMQFLLQDHPEFFKGVRHAIGEFGGFPLYAFGEKFYRIGVSQKQYAHLRLRFHAPGGHGSLPATDTVMTKLGEALIKLDQAKLPYYKTPLAEHIVKTIIHEVENEQAKEILRGLLDSERFESSLTAIGSGSERFESLFRDTANPTIATSGSKFNVIPSEALVEIDARILPGRTTEDLVSFLENILGDEAEIELLAFGPRTKPTVDYTLYDTLAKILKELDPEGIPIPYLFNESPDGRLLEEYGIQNYGFLPMNLPPEIDLPSLIHGANERVPTAAIAFGAEALYKLLKRY
jgi:acetylornithine deacetylase/succinyl-diaminopimelate desuccinylase-like protein